MPKFLLTCVIWLYSIVPALAAPIINEVSPRGDLEWVELYNPDQDIYDLAGWRLKDGNTSTTDDIDLAGTINPGQYLVFSRNKGWLNDGGDSVTLVASDSAQADSISYGSVSEGKTYARIPDDSENWQIVDPSQGAPNPTPTPSPSPSPTPTPTSTSTPTPSPTPTPTPTATPAPSPSPSPSAKPSVKPSPSPSPSPDLTTASGTVAGETTEISLAGFGMLPSRPPSPLPTSTTKPSLRTDRLRHVMMIGGGLIIVSLTSLLGYRKYLASTKMNTHESSSSVDSSH